MEVSITVEDVEEIVGAPFDSTAQQCHSVSLAIVKSRRFPAARVARGLCKGVLGQHSWVALGNPYHDDTPIIDATLWSYDATVEGVWLGDMREGRHLPRGYGSIWEWGQPEAGDGKPIELTPTTKLSTDAQAFLSLLGPLDQLGWAVLSSAPVLGWPAGEIFAAMDDTPELKALVPIDILGMTTDRNPSGLYF
jgi:hypothetical protein